MHSFQNARAKNIPTIGNVVEAFQSFRNMIPPNDGVRKYKQLIKNSYPTMFNGVLMETYKSLIVNLISPPSMTPLYK